MPLTMFPNPATLAQVYQSQGKNPATDTDLVAGNTTPPKDFVVPTCNISTESIGSGSVPSAAASRLGIPSKAQKYIARLALLKRAAPGTNAAIYLKAGIYETNWTLPDSSYLQRLSDGPAAASLPTYLEPWRDATQNRVYLIMPHDLASLNAAAEREHCSDFIHAYHLTLVAVDAAFGAASAAPTGEFMSPEDAYRAMEAKVKQRLHPTLASVAFDPRKLRDRFVELQEKSRTGRDGKKYHSFGLETAEPPKGAQTITYLTGQPRGESSRVFLRFTRGDTRIGEFSSSAVITVWG